MTERERRKYIRYMTLKDELEEEKQHGYELAFAGEKSDPAEIARICVFEEESSYMRDYVRNPSGALPILNFNKVKRTVP